MSEQQMKLPDGTPFDFWDDETDYTKVYHVACEHPEASDENSGTEDQPFATINRAAAILLPGEKVIVHEGVYRECVCPARGGEGPDQMIAYETAPGETVCIRGSEPWAPEVRPSSGWNLGSPENGAKVWMADLPAELFVGYNPFLARNTSAELWTFTREWKHEEVETFLMRCGSVFVNGKPLKQVFRVATLATTDGAFWVEDPGLRVHFRLPGDADPQDAEFEVSAREQVFAPAERHLGYIRVTGFRLEHSGDAIPVPQRALLSTTRGHHWIIEDNAIRHANAVGIDAGAQDWKASDQDRSGYHTIRRNTVRDCGACGIAGGTGVNHTLVEDNLIERIGGLNVERIWECAGLKFHVCDGVLIRRNVFRHITNAAGLWLDVKNQNCRITGNVFTDIQTLQGGVYMECSHDLNLVDRNVFWDIRCAGDPPSGGMGCKADSNDNLVVAHNLFGEIESYAASVNLNQANRQIQGRVGLCRGNKVLNNIFIECPKRILFGRHADNSSDGNLFDIANGAASLCIRYPDPEVLVNLEGWAEYYGLDTHAAQAKMDAEFCPESLELTFEADGEMPECQVVEAMQDEPGLPPGPFGQEQWQAMEAGEMIAQKFPLRGESSVLP